MKMSFSEVWRKNQDPEPRDTMDTMDTINPKNNSVHSVHIVHRKKNLKKIKSDEIFFDFYIKQVIADLGNRGVSIMDYPQATRHRAIELDTLLTEAANKGDRKTFLGYLEQWRECFH